MRIAINTLSLSNTKAGMGNYIYHLVDNLAVIDKNNTYLIFISEANKGFFNANQENLIFIKVGRFMANKFIRFLWEQFVLPVHIFRYEIDVLHSPGFVIPFFASCRRILTIADTTFITHAHSHTFFKQIYFGLLMPLSIKRADSVISISKNTKSDILSIVNVEPNKIIPIYLAADDIFKKSSKERARSVLRRKYSHKGNGALSESLRRPFLLFVGVIEPRKNIEGILHAFYELKDTLLKRHRLVIVGKKGWKCGSIFSLIESLGLRDRVIFTGYVPDEDLVNFYNAADILLYPSFYEGFGIPIVEAMSCGCPVITSDVSSMPELAGNAAMLVNPHNNHELVRAIASIFQDKSLRRKLISQGLVQSRRFSWKKCAEETLRVYLAK